MAKSARKSFILFVILAVFSLVFYAFLAVGLYYYFAGDGRVTLASLAPGVPAFFLMFKAIAEWKEMRAARKLAAYRKRRAAEGGGDGVL